MLRVKTKLRQSKIHGIGVFADQFIPKGTVTWEYDPKYDVCFTKKEIHGLPEPGKGVLLFYCYYDKKLNRYILCADHLRHINHAKQKKLENIVSTPRRDIAARDIKKGEELICDYNKFDPEYFKRHGLKKKHLN